MDLRLGIPLTSSINMRGGARGAYTPTRHHVTTLDATSSRPDPKTLAACEVLAHPCATFHPCTCGLCGGAVVVVATLISYDDMRLLPRRSRGDDHDQLLSLHQHVATLYRCSNFSFTALCI
jgi:hypothetical protein